MCVLRDENQTYFLKRYLLNESNIKELVVINSSGTSIVQYRPDPHQYCYHGQVITLKDYPDTFEMRGGLTDLYIEDGELSMKGFSLYYRDWLCRKEQAFDEKIAQI